MPERSIARERLQRTMPFSLERAAADPNAAEGTDGLTLEGHAAVFDSPTLIDSWEGRFFEQVARGAFKKTFAERTPVLQFDHGHHPLIGSIPIGRIRMAKEDQQGAYVKARLHDNWLIQPVRDAIADESITGMSFRFTVVREEWKRQDGSLITDDNELMGILWAGDPTDTPTRTLREIKVPELGPVVFPAYDNTDVGVRSGVTTIDLGRLLADPSERKRLARALWVAERDADSDDEELPPESDSDGTKDPEPVETDHSDEPPGDVDDDAHRSDAPAPTDGHADSGNAGASPAAPRGEEPQRSSRTTRDRRSRTLAYLDERLQFERTQICNRMDDIRDTLDRLNQRAEQEGSLLADDEKRWDEMTAEFDELAGQKRRLEREADLLRVKQSKVTAAAGAAGGVQRGSDDMDADPLGDPDSIELGRFKQPVGPVDDAHGPRPRGPRARAPLSCPVRHRAHAGHDRRPPRDGDADDPGLGRRRRRDLDDRPRHLVPGCSVPCR
jgi:HK97 family phage prohead protease